MRLPDAVTRTDEEVLKKIEELHHFRFRDFAGHFRRELILTLTYHDARKLITEDIKHGDWDDLQLDRHPEAVLERLKKSIPDCWQTANRREPVPAMAMMQRVSAMLWLLGEDDVVTALQDHTYFGKAHLRSICEYYDWPWKKWDDGSWCAGELAKIEPRPLYVPALPFRG